MTLAPNTPLGPYVVLAPLGAGGMGEVYRARDGRLDREVAIKVLPETLARDPLALARFEREAKAVAALSHPNILSIYDIGSQNLVSYVVTELLEGETLRERMGRAAISWRQAVEISVSVADGLAAAHTKGIIHRDLKPENVFITTAGHVKILDFGLARMEPVGQSSSGQASDSTPTMTLVTRPGMILGTLNYMSPEQVRGLQTDARSDIFSLGCVVYEMVAGRRAFTGDTPADTMTAILKEEPSGIRDSRTNIRPELDRVIARCLEKKPEQRFQSAPDLAFTLRSILADSGATPGVRRPQVPWWAKAAIIALVAGGLVVGAFMVRRELRFDHREAREAIDSLAVLPLENVSRDPEQEYFVDGMTEALISDLAKIGGLKVISRTSVMRYKATTKSLPEIAKELNVDAVVEGSVQRAGDRVRITAQLIHATTDEHLWSESYDRDLRDVLRLQSEVARTIAQEIKVTLTPQEQARMAAVRPVNPEAHQAYLKGRFHWNKRTREGVQEAVKYFEQAISLDPEWPLGYAGLGDAYLLLPWYTPVRPGEAIPRARAAAARALELDESLGEAHATMGNIAGLYDWDWRAAEREYQRALALSPNYATAHHWYSLYLRYVGRYQEAIAEITKAQELDPLSLIIGVNVGEAHEVAGDYARSESSYRKTLELDPDYAMAHMYLAGTLLLRGNFADAITEAREAARLSKNEPFYAARLGYICAKAGQSEEARRILDELAVRSTQSYVPPIHMAFVHAGLDEKDRMFEWLERAIQERDAWLLNDLTDPLLAHMRSDPRFADLIRRVGLPPLPVPRGTDPPKSHLTKGGSRGVNADKHTLAVLPFVNQSGNPDDEYFSDGMTDELASALMKVPGLRVAGRSSAYTFKGKNVESRQVGAALGVAAVLEGTVRRSGSKLRVTAQLINAADGLVRWSEKYEREASDVFAVQDDITADIVASLKLNLGVESDAELRAGRTNSPEAHDLYLRGRFLAFKQTEEGLRKGLEYFEKAIEKDPGYAPAYAGMAFAYMYLADAFAPPNEAYPKAKAAVLKALELDGTNAEAHTYLGLIQWFYDWEFESMDVEFRRALQLNPNSMEAHNFYGTALCGMRRFDEGLAEVDRAIVLDPLSPVPSWAREYCLTMVRRYDDAIAQNRKTRELDPTFFYLESMGALVYREKMMFSESVAEYQRLQRVIGGQPIYGLAITYARMDRTSEARDILKEFLELSKRKYISPDHIAAMYAGLGERDQAFAWLDRAYEARSGYMVAYILGSPDYDSLRSDPRFEDLLRRIGLTPFAPKSTKGSSSKPAAEKIMLAVLPFENLSRDPEQDYFSDGLTEEMISQLSKLNPKKLGVIARTSAMHYKNTAKTIDAIGRELGVAYIVEGSVRRAGERVRITAQLIAVSDQTHLWAENYERDLKDIFALQSDVAERIAGSLTVELLPEAVSASARARTINPAAHQAYLKGRFHWNKRTADGLKKAVEFFEQAVALDPDWPLAYAGLADAYLLMPDYSPVRPGEAIPKARAAATKALEMDESLGEAHTTTASIASNYDWDRPTAEREYKRALALSPNYATAHHWYAEHLLLMGRHDEAIKEITKAQELDPVSLIIGSNAGWVHYVAGNLEQAESQLRKTLELGPDFAYTHQVLAITLFLQGRFAEAIKEAREAVRLSNNFPYYLATLGYVCAKAGQPEEARKILDELAARSKEMYVAPTHFALVHAGLEERDRMFEWLEKACQEHDAFLGYNLPDPLLAPMRSDPRFADLVRRVGLPAIEN